MVQEDPHTDVKLPLVNQAWVLNVFLDDERCRLDVVLSQEIAIVRLLLLLGEGRLRILSLVFALFFLHFCGISCRLIQVRFKDWLGYFLDGERQVLDCAGLAGLNVLLNCLLEGVIGDLIVQLGNTLDLR
jgi:hypothetical protein